MPKRQQQLPLLRDVGMLSRHGDVALADQLQRHNMLRLLVPRELHHTKGANTEDADEIEVLDALLAIAQGIGHHHVRAHVIQGVAPGAAHSKDRGQGQRRARREEAVGVVAREGLGLDGNGLLQDPSVRLNLHGRGRPAGVHVHQLWRRPHLVARPPSLREGQGAVGHCDALPSGRAVLERDRVREHLDRNGVLFGGLDHLAGRSVRVQLQVWDGGCQARRSALDGDLRRLLAADEADIHVEVYDLADSDLLVHLGAARAPRPPGAQLRDARYRPHKLGIFLFAFSLHAREEPSERHRAVALLVLRTRVPKTCLADGIHVHAVELHEVGHLGARLDLLVLAPTAVRVDPRDALSPRRGRDADRVV
mmetsp:Transcript_8144/g.30600  ORF Transcript_8144/g.30600 Transcript_8144/m.30600 type:complete len:365 (-) Transcript_8144:1755-2849(-)